MIAPFPDDGHPPELIPGRSSSVSPIARLYQSAGACTRPIRLAGSRSVVNRATGEVLARFDAVPAPGGHVDARCGNRRASVCRPCSTIYKYDAYHVVVSGLRGGKGVPGSVAFAPRLFVTLTAPSFGPVHLGPAKDGTLRSCHPARRDGLTCGLFHLRGDVLIGSPLDPDSYDYDGQVLFNASAGALWSRFTIEVRRALAEAGGIPRGRLREQVTVSFAKVAEFQARGVVHFHAVIRLDGAHGPGSPPPPWADVDSLTDAVRTAVHRSKVTTPGTETCPARVMTWGVQTDIRPVTKGRPTGARASVSDAAVARYVAKYATKSTESAGADLDPIYCRACRGSGVTAPDGRSASARPRLCEVCHGHGRRGGAGWLDDPALTPHARRSVETCWRLGAVAGLEELKLRRWAHMLGFRGHFNTKSRTYSVTFSVLRAERSTYTTLLGHAALGLSVGADAVAVIGEWRYAGRREASIFEDNRDGRAGLETGPGSSGVGRVAGGGA
jgi:hypothetical protein